MKRCISCGKDVEDLRHVCPHCGGSVFAQEFSGTEGLKKLDAVDKQMEASRLVDQGFSFIREGRFSEAEAALRKAIEINPYNATAHGNLGGVFYRQGKFTEAIPWLEKALELNPQLAGVPDALAHARSMAKKRK